MSKEIKTKKRKQLCASYFLYCFLELKERLYQNSWTLLIAGISYTFFVSKTDKPLPNVYLGAIFGVFYFIQKQKLEEVKFFLNVFEKFNTRYDKLNDDLAEIEREKKICPGKHQLKLIDYFNLCSEEYLIYKRGYIPKSVWLSWLSGMHQYWKIQDVQDLWLKELESKSYYDFNPETEFLAYKVN